MNQSIESPKISIIMPTYNGSKYIRQSIDSCLNQTYSNIELIIIDDCSKDETPTIIKSYSDPRIRYYRNETNQRLPQSLNIGFRQAQGEYMTWTSDDNYFAPTAIEEMYQCLKENNGHFVYCDLYNVYVNEQDKIKIRLLEDDHRIKVEDCVGACFLYSRHVLETVGEYNADAELVEDYEYWIRVSLHFKLHHIKKPLYFYRYHDLSLWGTKYAQIQIMEYLLKFKFDFLNEPEANWALRGLKLKAKNDYSWGHKLSNRLFSKGQITHTLNQFKAGQLTYRQARTELSSIIYGREDDAAHFVLVRKFMPEWEWGGTETLLMDWFNRINFGKCRISLVVPLGSKAIFEERMRDKPWKVNVIEMPFSLNASAWHRFRHMFNFFKNLRPDTVIFVHGWYEDFRSAEFLAGWVISHGKVFLHENGYPPTLEDAQTTKSGLGLWKIQKKFFVRLKSFFCRAIMTVSQGVKDRLVNYWKYPAHKINVIPHGIDTQHFDNTDQTKSIARESLRIPDSATIFFICARLSQEKQINLAIEAFDTIAKDHTNYFLYIAGQGPLCSDLKQLASRKSTAKQIFFLGKINSICPWLQASDIYIQSSEFESLGIALLEAMACGMICVSTRTAGAEDIIRDQQNGFLVSHDRDSMVVGINHALRLSLTERQVMSSFARNTVIERYDAAKNITKLFKIFCIPVRN